VKVGDKLAGFILVNQYTYLPESQYSIAEFFIMRKYRKCGIGRQVAVYMFDLFQGRWEVHQLPGNIAGQEFWRSVINAYTKGNFTETVIADQERKGIVQCFDNRVR
jgi:predicted acetyltransferase